MYTQYSSKLILLRGEAEYYEYSNPVRTGFSRRIQKRKVKEILQPNLWSTKYQEMHEKCVKNSLNRTKTNLRRLLNNNKFTKFVTLTFADEVFDLSIANPIFAKFIKRLSYKFPDLVYVAVPEFQKNGRVHYHLVTNSPYIENSQLAEMWDNGFVRINQLKGIKNIGMYLTKYLTKENYETRFFSKKKFFCSRNIERPEVILGYSAYLYYEKWLKNLGCYFEKTFDFNEYVGICKMKIIDTFAIEHPKNLTSYLDMIL